MRTKKLMTAEEGGVLMLLKGEKQITGSVATDPQSKASAETSFHTWARPDCRIYGSADSLNSEHGCRNLNDRHSKLYEQKEKVICGNSSFLSRFIEFRINDSKLCLKMATGTENGSEKPSGAEEPEISVLAESACTKSHVDAISSSRGTEAVDKQVASTYHFDNKSLEVGETLSRPCNEEEGIDVEVEDDKSTSEHYDVNPDKGRVTGDLHNNVLSEISAVCMVEELRIRNEGQPENANYSKEVCENAIYGVNKHKCGSSVTKSTSGAKEDVKIDSRRSGASTKDSPPRKVSFRVRASSNSGRLSSSCVSSAASRRSSASNKALLTDPRVPILSSSKVAALASKFNAIIHENKGQRNGEIIQNDSKKKLLISQFATGLATNTTKRPPSAEKLFVSRRNSSSSKRDSSLSNTGVTGNVASLGAAFRKQSFVKQPLVETESSHKSSSNSNTKDCKRRSNMAYRPSAAGNKSVSVKAAIQIFEKNVAVTPSTKKDLVVSEDKRNSAMNCSTGESKQPVENAEAKKEPKYQRVIFKRDATLVRVTLDCEEVCNEDKTSQKADANVNIQCQQATARFLPNNCEEENEKFRMEEDEVLKSYSAEAKSGQNRTVVTVKQGSGRNETEHNQTKTKPIVPIKKVTKEQTPTNVPFSKNKSNDSNCVKETCKPGSVCDTARNAGMAENTLVRHDKLTCPQNSSAMLESSVKKTHTTQESENLQKVDKESVAPNRSFLWGAPVPGTNQSAPVPGTNQSAPVPGTNQSAPVPGTNQSAPVPGTNQSASVPGTNQSAPVPGTNQFTSVPGTNQSAPVPGTNQFTSVPGTNQSAPVPGTNQTTSVPGTNQFTSVPGTNQSAPVPGTNQFTSVPGTNQSAPVPGTNQFTSVPGTNQSAPVPGTNQTTSVPGTNQFTSVPGTNQSAPVPGTNQFTSVPGTNQSAPVPGTNQFTSVPGTNQSAPVPGTNQTTSVPGTNQSTSIASSNQTPSVPCTDQLTSVPGSNQPTSVPIVVTKHYESAKPDNFANVTIYSADDLYDDVYPPSAVCSSGTTSNHPYSVVQPQDDDVYDDVGPPINEEKQCSRCTVVAAAVSNRPERAYEYCQGPMEPPVDQNYDDCEGEVYQCIGQDAESNIYDDVKPQTTLRTPDDVASISNCYESIYSGGDRLMTPDGRASLDSATRKKGGSSSASSSIGNHSCCDQSNSLYGVGGSRFDSASVSQASTVSGDYGPHEVRSYQLTRMGSGQPRSDTSDEWVDVEITDSEGEGGEDAVAGYQGRPRSRKSPRRSRKVRKQWSKPARKAAGNLANGDHSSDSDGDHHYEILYEVVGNAKNDPVPYDDFDSFDSDVSDETYVKPLRQADCDVANGRLPQPPPGQNIYGISKIAEAAGKKMLKLGKSLRRIRNKRNSSDMGVQHKACPPLPTSPRPPPPTPPSLQSPPVLPPRISEKSVSSGNLSGHKYWSLRKFKRSISTLDQSSLTSHSGGSKKETATFYLTQALDADTGSIEGSSNRMSTDATDIYSENGDPPTSPSSLTSSKTVVYDAGIEANCSPEVLQKTLTNATSTNKQRPMSAPERRNSGNTRPNSPPPLPPHSSGSSDNVKKPRRKEKRSSSNTSWYAECGLFDQTAEVQNTVIVDTPKRNVKKQEQPISNSWYAEVGLWEMSTSSPNDSSVSEQDARSQHADVSGGDSPLTAGSPENSGIIERRFADEPLYQFYTAAVVERDMRSEMDSDGYEEIGDGSRKPRFSRPTAMELIQPREGQHRTLWCEIPEVVSSGILSTIGPHQKKLQEAKFEIITSEASYINSLNVLEKHFMSSLETYDESVLSKNDRRTLFSNLIPVKTCSEHFLAELEECWQDNILLNGICEVVYKHASNNFSPYVKYCSNQICLDRTLRGLKEQNMKFSEVLLQLENNPICQSLSLHSFLMLPMQRITRLPLLIDAVLTRLNQTDDEYTTCQLALATLNKIVQNCNEDARKMERMEEILILSRQLYFPSEVKAVPIISSARWLIRKGELTHLVWRGDEGKLTFGKKFSRIQIHMFLFTDILVVTKKKRKSAPDATGDECYAVIDYCPRNLVQMTSTEGMTNLPVKFTSDGGRNLVLLTMLQNHEKKTVEMVLSCRTESDRQRWLEAVSPPVSDNPDETVYEEWDCPQVMAIHPYVACQPDELSLEVADVVNVLRKMTDGWYHGERIRDGEKGWFPGNYTSEVASAHVRARNLKQRYRLLALSGNFLEAQRKEKQAK